MNSLIKTVLFSLLISVFLSGKAYSAVLTSKYISDCVKRDLTEQVSLMVKGTVDIEVGDIPYKSVEVPNGNIKVKSTVSFKIFTPRTVAKIVVSVDGHDVKIFGAPVKFNVYNDVWVAKDFIRRGESLSLSNVLIEKREVGNIVQNVVTSAEPFGKLVMRTFSPGEIIDVRFIESAPLVSRNSLVSVIFQTSSVMVTVQCEALDDGKSGDIIRVRSKEYRKEYKGKVLDTGGVLVNL